VVSAQLIVAGERAVGQLLAQVGATEAEPPGEALATELVVRGSTGAASARR